MTLIDMALPTAMFTSIFGALSCVAGALLIIIGAKYLAAAVPVALVALYYLQMFYLKTSRQIRHLGKKHLIGIFPLSLDSRIKTRLL